LTRIIPAKEKLGLSHNRFISQNGKLWMVDGGYLMANGGYLKNPVWDCFL
jgi:hypothetical protein